MSTPHAAILDQARAWRTSAEALAELALQDLAANDPQRHGLAGFLDGLSDESVMEYEEWRRRYPELTAAMVYAGQRAAARRIRC